MAPNPHYPVNDLSSKKKIYLIRHGQSMVNAGGRPGTNGDHLSDHGRKQAAYMGERCSRLPIEALVSSTLLRALETAQIIGERIGKEPDTSDLFVERTRPSVQKSMKKEEPESQAIDEAIKNNFTIPGWRHSDEENFDDLKARALEALRYLGDRPEEHIAVVTHGFFLRVLIAVAVFGESLTGRECDIFIRHFHMENTGLTILNFDGWETEQPWWIWTWNDHAHLG